MSSLTVMKLTDRRWERFVASQPAATPFHRPEWASLIADCYGFSAFVIATTDAAGEIRAGMPVVEVRHIRGEPKWVSLPFTDYCPPLVAAREEEAGLVCAVRRAAETAGIRRVEVRAPLAGTTPVSIAYRHGIALGSDSARVYAALPSRTRTHIRQAERRGLTVRRAAEPEDLTDTFYRLHLRTRRRQGVPVQPRRFFRMLWESVISTGLGLVFVAEASAEPVAAAVVLAWNRTMIGKFIASNEEAWSLRPNNLIVWHAIKAGCEWGCQWFDFGRTDAGNEGLRAYKRSWRAVEEPLVYGALGIGPGPASAANGRTNQMLASVIRHGPLVLCRAVGEALYRYAA